MNPYSQSPDWSRIQRGLRRADRRARFGRWWYRWGDGLLAGLIIGLTLWMITTSDPDRPIPHGDAVRAETTP